jgi:hypothetical protein
MMNDALLEVIGSRVSFEKSCRQVVVSRNRSAVTATDFTIRGITIEDGDWKWVFCFGNSTA